MNTHTVFAEQLRVGAVELLAELGTVPHEWEELENGRLLLNVHPASESGYPVSLAIGDADAALSVPELLYCQLPSTGESGFRESQVDPQSVIATLRKALGSAMRVYEVHGPRGLISAKLQEATEGRWKTVCFWRSIEPLRYFGRRREVIRQNRYDSRRDAAV